MSEGERVHETSSTSQSKSSYKQVKLNKKILRNVWVGTVGEYTKLNNVQQKLYFAHNKHKQAQTISTAEHESVKGKF